MNFLQAKKKAFFAIVNSIKGFLKTATGTSSLTLTDCVDDKSLVTLSVTGNTGGVGDYDSGSGKYKVSITVSGMNVLDLNAVQLTNATISGNTITATTASPYVDFLLPTGDYTIAFTKSGITNVYVCNGKQTAGNVIKTINGEYGTFSFSSSHQYYDGYLRLKWFQSGGSLTDIMLVAGTYTEANMPDYVDYVTPISSSISLDSALTDADTLSLDYNAKTADVNGTAITIDWDNAPSTFPQTTILTATTSVLPTAMSADYYSTTP